MGDVKCRYCGTEYEVPDGLTLAVEHTLDVEPPAHVIAWGATPEDASKRRFYLGEVLHECRNGKPFAAGVPVTVTVLDAD